MDKYIYDESNGLWYELQGDYYIPCITLPTKKEHKFIGLWGQRYKRYLQEHKRAVYTTLLTSGKLNGLLLIDWLAFLCISVCLTSKIFASEIPDNNAISAVLFHSCLAVLSASISAALGLFLPIFLVGR